jgi:hypothetical protein
MCEYPEAFVKQRSHDINQSTEAGRAIAEWRKLPWWRRIIELLKG